MESSTESVDGWTVVKINNSLTSTNQSGLTPDDEINTTSNLADERKNNESASITQDTGSSSTTDNESNTLVDKLKVNTVVNTEEIKSKQANNSIEIESNDKNDSMDETKSWRSSSEFDILDNEEMASFEEGVETCIHLNAIATDSKLEGPICHGNTHVDGELNNRKGTNSLEEKNRNLNTHLPPEVISDLENHGSKQTTPTNSTLHVLPSMSQTNYIEDNSINKSLENLPADLSSQMVATGNDNRQMSTNDLSSSNSLSDFEVLWPSNSKASELLDDTLNVQDMWDNYEGVSGSIFELAACQAVISFVQPDDTLDGSELAACQAVISFVQPDGALDGSEFLSGLKEIEEFVFADDVSPEMVENLINEDSIIANVIKDKLLSESGLKGGLQIEDIIKDGSQNEDIIKNEAINENIFKDELQIEETTDNRSQMKDLNKNELKNESVIKDGLLFEGTTEGELQIRDLMEEGLLIEDISKDKLQSLNYLEQKSSMEINADSVEASFECILNVNMGLDVYYDASDPELIVRKFHEIVRQRKTSEMNRSIKEIDDSTLPPDDDDRCESDMSGFDTTDLSDLSTSTIGTIDFGEGVPTRRYRHQPNPSLDQSLSFMALVAFVFAIGIGIGHYIGSSSFPFHLKRNNMIGKPNFTYLSKNNSHFPLASVKTQSVNLAVYTNSQLGSLIGWINSDTPNESLEAVALIGQEDFESNQSLEAVALIGQEDFESNQSLEAAALIGQEDFESNESDWSFAKSRPMREEERDSDWYLRRLKEVKEVENSGDWYRRKLERLKKKENLHNLKIDSKYRRSEPIRKQNQQHRKKKLERVRRGEEFGEGEGKKFGFNLFDNLWQKSKRVFENLSGNKWKKKLNKITSIGNLLMNVKESKIHLLNEDELEDTLENLLDDRSLLKYLPRAIQQWLLCQQQYFVKKKKFFSRPGLVCSCKNKLFSWQLRRTCLQVKNSNEYNRGCREGHQKKDYQNLGLACQRRFGLKICQLG